MAYSYRDRLYLLEKSNCEGLKAFFKFIIENYNMTLCKENKNQDLVWYRIGLQQKGMLRLTKKDELAAVTVPCGLMNAAFNADILSMLDGRIPLSMDTGDILPV